MPCNFWKAQQGLTVSKFIMIMLIALLGRATAPRWSLCQRSRTASASGSAPAPRPPRPPGFLLSPLFPSTSEPWGFPWTVLALGEWLQLRGGARRGRQAAILPPRSLLSGFLCGRLPWALGFAVPVLSIRLMQTVTSYMCPAQLWHQPGLVDALAGYRFFPCRGYQVQHSHHSISQRSSLFPISNFLGAKLKWFYLRDVVGNGKQNSSLFLIKTLSMWPSSDYPKLFFPPCHNSNFVLIYPAENLDILFPIQSSPRGHKSAWCGPQESLLAPRWANLPYFEHNRWC